jgi:hypothetical protein
MVCIALLHAFSTNKEFQPVWLYIVAFFIDVTIIDGIFL